MPCKISLASEIHHFLSNLIKMVTLEMPAAMQAEHKPFFHKFLPSAVIGIHEWWSWLVGSKALSSCHVTSVTTNRNWWMTWDKRELLQRTAKHQNNSKAIAEWYSFHSVFYLITLTVSSYFKCNKSNCFSMATSCETLEEFRLMTKEPNHQV